MDMPVVNESIEEVKMALRKKIIQLTAMEDGVFNWSDDIPFVKRPKLSKSTVLGVYRITHIPTNTPKYVGQGVISQRHRTHRDVFLNDGKRLEKSDKGSHAAAKMFEFDPDINNWSFACIEIDEKSLVQTYEDECIAHCDTIKNGFNGKGMSGKN